LWASQIFEADELYFIFILGITPPAVPKKLVPFASSKEME
jgi:hypothetical protein